MGKAIDRAKAFLATRGVAFVESSGTGWTRIALSAAPNAEFAFSMWDHPEGSVDISAKRTEGSDDEYFFSLTYEQEDFKDAEALENKSLEMLDLIISNPISIRYSRGWIFENFVAEIGADSGKRIIHGSSAFRWGGFKFGNNDGKERTYHALPLSPKTKDG